MKRGLKMITKTIAAVAIAVLAGAGCSFSPVYSDGSPINAMSLAFDLGEPTSRVEQVIYQEMSLRFAESSAPKTPKLVIRATSSVRDAFVTENAANAPDTYEVTVTGAATATYEGEIIFTATRRATAQYATTSQTMANQSAREIADERAAKAVAESLRLALLARFPHSGSYL